ncbi:MAG: hypothetical protein ACREQ5_24755, partial [Candidatus Dormibacteria bacterium]
MRRIALALIVAASVLVSAFWALRVPFFEAPDEEAHLDYAFALVDVGGLRPLPGSYPASNVTPQVRFLARVSKLRRMRYDPGARVVPGYGTAAYFRAAAAEAPEPSAASFGPGRPFPYVAYFYPIGAYAFFASAIASGFALGHSLIAAFFAARLADVALLVPTLLAAYAIFRPRFGDPAALLATAALGLF